MSLEGFWIFLALFIGGPMVIAAVIAAVVVISVASVICAVPVGIVWALAAMVRPQIVKAALPSWPPPGTDVPFHDTKVDPGNSDRPPQH